jgi:hypothetical protein
MSARCGGALVGLVLIAAAGPSRALPADEIFQRVAPGVWSVKAYSADEKLLASASGVVVAAGKLVTSCQVLARAQQVQLRRGNAIFDAKLEFPDVERDLCQLDVPGLSASPPPVGSVRGLRPGQRLYVVGFARGNDQSIGEGLVSAMSEAGTGKERLQTTIPAAPGLRGAGVFDEEARLVGIVTSSPQDAAASVFAVPADWLAQVPERARTALAARAAAAAAPAAAAAAGSAAAAGYPAPGTEWVYGFTERIFSRRQIEVTVRAVRVDGALIEETVTAAGGTAARRQVNAPDSRFFVHELTSSSTLVELAPYLLVSAEGKPLGALKSPDGYPIGSPGLPGWSSTVTVRGWEQICVKAGSYKALRVDVSGQRSAPIGGRTSFAGRFEMRVWYAPDAKRIVRLEHRIWSADSISSSLVANEVVELLSYRPGP